jgi:hypothetical protein
VFGVCRMSGPGPNAKYRSGPEMSAVKGRPDEGGHHETDASDPKPDMGPRGRNRYFKAMLAADHNRMTRKTHRPPFSDEALIPRVTQAHVVFGTCLFDQFPENGRIRAF